MHGNIKFKNIHLVQFNYNRIMREKYFQIKYIE